MSEETFSARDECVSELMAAGHSFAKAYKMAYHRGLAENVVKFWVKQMKKRRKLEDVQRMRDLGQG